ncbi:MAG: Alpha/beta fold family hydrolase [candidate division WS6 bacterium GW2011_WS6_36_26]|nr:MAG: Alpha/beta fold family hydrolase [candidate division WS6 bacterium GW2011_WS6_36_26]HAM96497.1 alpha/beta hydrolase [Patescibacteria group bacterium]
MKNAIILHAMGNTPNDFWYPWLKSNLEQRGYDVWAPQLPDTNNPQISNWVPYIINNGKFNEDTILIGHSAGAAVILSVLEELKVKISQAIIVSGFSTYPGGDGILKPIYDWEKIRNSAEEIVIINSDDDPYGHNDTRGRIMFDMLDMPNSAQIILKKQGHMGTEEFNQEYKKFPLLLRLVK